MRIVPDTNVVISGLFWHGPPRQILDGARAGRLILYSTPILLAELQDVLVRPKFAQRLSQAGVTSSTLVVGFAALARVIQPAAIPAVVIADPDDDAVLACAAGASAEAIVSGDHHLLDLGNYQGIPIWRPSQLVTTLGP